MKTRFALALLTAVSLLSTFSVVSASPAGASVQLKPAAATFAAGADAVFNVSVSGDGADAYSLVFTAEGGTVSGALALNETGEGTAAGAVFVRRDTPGSATLIAHLDGEEVARATATFVDGAPLTVEVTLLVGPDAAARTWFFDVLDASGAERAFIQVGTSGDRPTFAVVSQPLPYGDYVVRPALGRDVAAECSGSAFFVMSPAAGAPVAVTPAGAVAKFTVQPCVTASAPAAVPGDVPGSVDDVAGARADGAPLPPATGSGKAETPKLTEGQAGQLARLFLGLCGMFVLGVCVTRLLAKVAPVKDPGKKKQ